MKVHRERVWHNAKWQTCQTHTTTHRIHTEKDMYTHAHTHARTHGRMHTRTHAHTHTQLTIDVVKSRPHLAMFVDKVDQSFDERLLTDGSGVTYKS